MEFDKQLVSHITLDQHEAAKCILQGYSYLHKYTDSSGQTLLHVAAKCGNSVMTEYLIQCGCNVNAQDNLGVTPLMLAITEACDVATVEILLNANADIYITDLARSSALRKVIKICQQNWLETLSPRILERTNNHRILKMFFSRLQHSFALDPKLTATIIQETHCPLALVMFMNNASATKYLLSNGYLPPDEYLRNWSTLHIAVLLADLGNVSFLVDYGVNVNDQDNRRQTPLFLYDLYTDNNPDQLEILKILVNNGASLFIPRFDGLTLMEYFFVNGQKNTLVALAQSDTRELHKCTVNGRTPLHCWLENTNHGIDAAMEILVNKNAIDINARDAQGTTALVKAVNAGSLRKVEFLIKHGAIMNFIDIFQNTDLYEKVINPDGYDGKYAKIVQLLVYRKSYWTDPIDGYSPEIEFSANWGFQSIHTDQQYILAKLILKRLALDEDTHGGESIMSESAIMKIESRVLFKRYYQLCKLELRAMKKTTVYESVTLYKLLTQSHAKITLYARSTDFVAAFEAYMETKDRNNFCYYDLIRHRTGSAITLATMRRKASCIICSMTQLYPDPDNDVFSKIVEYMSQQELRDFIQAFDTL